MGATIYLNNNGKQIDVGVATVRERLDSNGYADFENIYVSGIGTINNIKSNNFSVSAGIVTVRQDQTAIIGVSTGADRVSVQTTSSSATHQVSFVNNVGLGSNYPLHLIDSDTNQLTYVPSTNVLSCTRFVGNVSGIATGADNINVDPQNGNTDYQVIFSNPGEYDYKRMYIDSESSRLTYNPSLNRLSVTNIIATSITGGLIGTATRADLINVDEQSGNTNYQILFSDNQGANYQRPYIDTDSTKLLYNPSTNTLQSTNIIATTVTAGLAGTATRADFINVDEKNDNTNYQVLFSTNQGAGYQRPYIDSNSGKFIYNPSTNTLTADNLAGRGDNLTNLDGSNISQGLINEARLPNATTSAQGVVQLDNTYPPTSTSTTRTATTNVSRQLYTAIQTLISSGSKMLFYQAAAPVGWTKLTTDNNKTLRVVSGSGGGSGGTNTFTSAFSERSVPVPTHNHNANAGDQSANHTHGGEAVSANANHSHNGNAAYENVPHNHGINAGSANGRFLSGINWSKGDFDSDGGKEAITNIGYNKQDVGYSNPNVRQGNAAHSHSISMNAANAAHGHNLSINAQNADHQHAITVASAGTGNNMDFRVQYIDVIVCRKD